MIRNSRRDCGDPDISHDVCLYIYMSLLFMRHDDACISQSIVFVYATAAVVRTRITSRRPPSPPSDPRLPPKTNSMSSWPPIWCAVMEMRVVWLDVYRSFLPLVGLRFLWFPQLIIDMASSQSFLNCELPGCKYSCAI